MHAKLSVSLKSSHRFHTDWWLSIDLVSFSVSKILDALCSGNSDYRQEIYRPASDGVALEDCFDIDTAIEKIL